MEKSVRSENPVPGRDTLCSVGWFSMRWEFCAHLFRLIVKQNTHAHKDLRDHLTRWEDFPLTGDQKSNGPNF